MPNSDLIVSYLERLENKLDAMTLQVNDNITNIEKLKDAYASLAARLESLQGIDTRLGVVEKKQSNFSTGLTVAMTIMGIMGGTAVYAGDAYLQKVATDAGGNAAHQILDQQAVLNDNKISVSETKTKSKK